MFSFQWKSTYELGFTLIDEQHKKLFAIMNNLYEARHNSTSNLIVASSINELINYTLYHFTSEEQLFAQYNYPYSEAHIIEHNDFIMKVNQLKNNEDLGDILLSLKTLDYLKDWTITHILGTDKQFADFVKDKELGL